MAAQRYLTSLDALTSGVTWAPAHVTADAQARALVNSDFTGAGLFAREATDTNGLAVIDRADLITLPWPRAIVQSHQDLLWGDAPELSSDVQAIADWLLTWTPDLIQELEKVTLDLAVTGYGVLLAERGRLRRIDSTAWQLVIDAGDASVTLGHVLTFPYSSKADGLLADRLRVTTIPAGLTGAVTSTWAYGNGKIGERLAGPLAVDVQGIWAIGDGMGNLAGMTDLLRELAVRYTSVARVLNRHSSPSIQGPPDSALLTDEAAYRAGGMYLPRTDASEGYEYLTWDGKLESAFAAIDRLTRQLALLAGPAALDLTGAGESGSARQALLWQAEARANRIRRDLETVLLLAIPAAAGTPGRVTIDWAAFTFERWPERAEAAAQLVTAGMLTADEARAQLGIRN